MMLYHVGCGRALFDSEHARGMALSCACGAYSPIVAPDLNNPAPGADILPSSLVSLMMRAGERELMASVHVETYLGYSDFRCPAKAAWEIKLKALGMTAAGACSEQRCRDRAERLAVP